MQLNIMLYLKQLPIHKFQHKRLVLINIINFTPNQFYYLSIFYSEMKRKELEFQFEQLMRERSKWFVIKIKLILIHYF